ncbi:MAG: PHP domain-containing protein [Deltaproteobacteria bacterium]
MFDFEYVGNLHIHSKHSDGGATVSEIAASAAELGLDFIALNDHAYAVDDLHLEEEGVYGSVLVLLGLEIGVRYHQYLAYGLKKLIRQDELSPQEVIDKVNGQGGFGFMAHPFEKGMPFSERSVAYTWNDLSVRGHSGLSIWNFTSRWKERVRTVLHGPYFLALKTQTLKGPSRRTLDFWDSQCAERRTVAIGTSDAHGTKFKWGPIRVMPFTYDYLLNTINVHIFLNKKMPEDFHEAKQEIFGAMRAGRLFIGHDNLCGTKGFRFYFLAEDGSDLYMGEEGIFQPGEFVVESPFEAEIRLIKNGSAVQRWRGTELVHKVTEKGVYRIEAYRRLFPFGWRPWVFTNPIYLR